MDKADQLKKLSELASEGAITEEEFAQAKSEVLRAPILEPAGTLAKERVGIAIVTFAFLANAIHYHLSFFATNSVGALELCSKNITIATIIVMSILISVEAHILGAGNESDRDGSGGRRMGPFGWLVFSMALTLYALPAWLFRRAEYGRKNFALAGMLLSLAFAFQVIQVRDLVSSEYCAKRMDEIFRDFQSVMVMDSDP